MIARITDLASELLGKAASTLRRASTIDFSFVGSLSSGSIMRISVSMIRSSTGDAVSFAAC